jgi:hypothetical protein
MASENVMTSVSPSSTAVSTRGGVQSFLTLTEVAVDVRFCASIATKASELT